MDFLTSCMASCKVSRFAPETRYRVPLDAALHLEFAILDEPDDFFCQLTFDACFNRDLLFDFISADFFYLSLIQASYVNVTLGELGHKNVQYLPQLEFIVRKNGQGVIRLLHTRVRSFEIKARADFLVYLVNRISDLLFVHFRNDVE